MQSVVLENDLYDRVHERMIPIALDAIENTTPTHGAGSVHYPADSRLKEGWIQGHVIVRVDTNFCPPLFNLFSDILQLAVSILVVNGHLAPHRDAKVPQMQRYHIPLMTDSSALWWDEINGVVRMREGYMYGPVPYTALHFAVGSNRIYRTHLLVDVAERASHMLP